MTSALTSAARNAYTRALPFALTLLVGAAALTLALAGARAIADIVGPVFLGAGAHDQPAPDSYLA